MEGTRQEDEVVTGNEPGGGPSFPAYEIRKRPSIPLIENFARAFFEGWQVGLGATGEFPCPLDLNGEPPAIDVSDKAAGYRKIADLFILGVRATAQAARGLPIGKHIHRHWTRRRSARRTQCGWKVSWREPGRGFVQA